jgi:hypothetical protein
MLFEQKVKQSLHAKGQFSYVLDDPHIPGKVNYMHALSLCLLTDWRRGIYIQCPSQDLVGPDSPHLVIVQNV